MRKAFESLFRRHRVSNTNSSQEEVKKDNIGSIAAPKQPRTYTKNELLVMQYLQSHNEHDMDAIEKCMHHHGQNIFRRRE